SFRFSPPRALALAAALLALLGLGVFVAAREWQRADKGAEEKGVLADLLSRALSTPATKISIALVRRDGPRPQDLRSGRRLADRRSHPHRLAAAGAAAAPARDRQARYRSYERRAEADPR